MESNNNSEESYTMSIVFFVLLFGIILNGVGLFSCFSKEKEQIQEEKRCLINLDDMDATENTVPVEEIPVKKETTTVGERVQEVLKAQSIPFEIDEDGDVCFEYHFHRFVLSNSKSTNCFSLDFGFREDFDEQERERYLYAANYLHAMYRLIRMTVYENDFVFSLDSFISPDTDFKKLLQISLCLLEEAYSELEKMVSRLEEEQQKSNSTVGFHEAQEKMLQARKGNEAEGETSDKVESPINSNRYRG